MFLNVFLLFLLIGICHYIYRNIVEYKYTTVLESTTFSGVIVSGILFVALIIQNSV